MERYNDDELVYLMRCGSQEAERCLYDYYYKQVSKWILPFVHYRFHGYDYEDYIQIAMLSFYQILNYYRDDQKASLKTFMRNSVIRRIKSIIRNGRNAQTSQKYMLFSLDDYIGDDENMCYSEIIADSSQKYQPEMALRIKETETYYETKMSKKISPQEQEVMKVLEIGYNQKEAAKYLNISVKSVYNAAYRYHKKLRSIDEPK